MAAGRPYESRRAAPGGASWLRDVASDVAHNGNGFPAPPKCLHKLGRFEGNREERGGLDEDAESASHQQLTGNARLLADF